jgi:hypothetical protein
LIILIIFSEEGIFLFSSASRTALGPIQPPIQRVPGAHSLGVKRPGRESDHSPPSSAEVKDCVELYLHSPNTSWRGTQLSTGTTLPFLFTFLYSNEVHNSVIFSIPLFRFLKSKYSQQFAFIPRSSLMVMDQVSHS